MKTIQLDQTKPGQRFRITLSCAAPIQSRAIKFIADIDEQVIFLNASEPLLHHSRAALIQQLRNRGLVYHIE